MKVFSLFYKDARGGFTKRLYRLYEELVTRGDEVHFLSCEPIPFQHIRFFPHIKNTRKGSQSGITFWFWFILSSLFRSLYIAFHNGIERIVTFGPFYTALCILPSVILKIPAVTLIRADNQLHSSNKVRNAFFFYADWLGIIISSRLIFVSMSLRNTYMRRYNISEAKCLIIPNNIEAYPTMNVIERDSIRESLGVANDDFLIATSGVFNADKNFAFLIEAMRDLSAHRVKLLIIGDEVVANGERQRLERFTSDLGLSSCIIFAGWRDDPRPLIVSSDLFIFPSKHEGSPNALLEALGCGIPCFGSDIDEIKEVLHYDELLFSLKESRILSENVLELLRNPEHLDRVRALSNERCCSYSFDWGQQVVSAIHSVE
jgi:glycosyltransferase involved in cell wall biosynthesis